ncbi:unnamed protein product [Closterium sp. NIES-53]
MQCASCVGDKLARHTFPDQGSDAENVLDVVHIDLCGPFRVAANDGSLYFLLLKDRKTRYVWVRPIAKKSDMLVIFDKWLKVVERKTSKTVKMLCFDRGGEFLDQAFTDLVEEKGILHNLTVRGFPSRSSPYTPQQNGMAKREMRTVVEAVRTMLLHMGVKHHWWHLDLRQAVWVHNCLERASLPSGMTPHELLFEKKPDLTMAQVWGYMVQFMVPKQQRCKNDLLRDPVNGVVEGREQDASTRTPSAPPPDSSSEMPPLLADIDEHEDKDVEEVPLPPPIVPLSATSSPSPSPPVVDLPQKRSSSDAVDEGRLGASPAAPTSCIAGGRRNAEKVADGQCQTTRERITRKLFALKPTSEKPAAETPASGEPTAEKPILEEQSDIANMTVKEALVSWKGKAVKAAMDEEIKSLISNGTWEVVVRPRGVNIMKNRWVLMTKYHVDDTVAHEKARLVVKGFMQLDMKNAFLHSKLDRVLYRYQPDYYNDKTGRVCKLLKQSPLPWYKELNDVLTGAGWKKSQVNEALYFKFSDDGVACWVLVYVDDLLAASSRTSMLKGLKELLEAAFQLREIKPIEKYLGLEIVRDRPARKLWLH